MASVFPPTDIQGLKEAIGLKQLVGENPEFQREIRKIPLVAKYDVPVLILGETGTGKELCARAIHYLSKRSGGPFVAVNCGAMQVDLIENEMFGHEAQAFTGASGSKPGVIQEADHGTLFLDEIDSLPAQTMLLRFLQEGEFKPLGSSKTKRADVRVIAATNIDIQQALHTHAMRQDLYYRLSVMSIHLPPLRERRDDIPLLASYFLSKWAPHFGKPIDSFSREALNQLTIHDWPGNIRELENTVERAVIMADESVVQIENIELASQEQSLSPDTSFRELKGQAVAQFERAYLINLLRSNNGNVSRAALSAKKSRRAFRQLLVKYHIGRSDLVLR